MVSIVKGMNSRRRRESESRISESTSGTVTNLSAKSVKLWRPSMTAFASTTAIYIPFVDLQFPTMPRIAAGVTSVVGGFDGGSFFTIELHIDAGLESMIARFRISLLCNEYSEIERETKKKKKKCKTLVLYTLPFCSLILMGLDWAQINGYLLISFFYKSSDK